MECPLCIRQQLLEKLKLSPQNQQIRLELVKLLHCEGEYITTGAKYATEKDVLCTIHKRWIDFEDFLRRLNTRETITLLFGENTRRPN